MTDSTPVETTDSAPWPVPEGSRLADKAWDLLGSMLLEAEELEPHLDDLVTKAPVRRDHGPHAVYLHDLAAIIDSLEKVQDRLKDVRAIADEAFCRALPMGTSNVSFADTRPMVPRFGGERTQWANELLRDDVKPRLLHDPESGEARTAAEAVEATLSVVSLNGSNVKVTGLRHLGLDPDDYCHKVPKAPVVQVVK